MQHRKSQIENLKQDLETESNLRIKNQEALALMIAQQMFLFSVLTGLSSRPVEASRNHYRKPILNLYLMNPDCTAKKLKAVGYTLDCPFFNGQYYISLVAVTYVAVLDPGLKEGSYVRRRFKDANVLPTYSAEGIPANALCLPIPEFYEWLKLHQPGRGYYKRFIKDFESQCEKLFGFTIQ